MWAAHLGGEMGSSQTVLPFKLAASNESLTAHGGLALFGEYLRAMSICGLINLELPGPGSAAGYVRAMGIRDRPIAARSP
jgi:hypothetical protein